MQAVLDDYRRWRDLGPGGLPANPAGWLITTVLRPLGRDTVALDADFVHAAERFSLPRRRGTRPAIAPYPIPHRETESVVDPRRVLALTNYVASFADHDPSRFHCATSRFERRGDALFVKDTADSPQWIVRARGEVAHVHSTQGSLHVVADPADVAEIIGRGWGERHPLSGRPLIGLPDSYLLLYAPRDADDQRVVEHIVDQVVRAAWS